MKLLWLSHLVPYPPKGGVLQRSYNLIHQLSKYHQVDLLAFIQKTFLESLFPSFNAGMKESMEVLSSFCRKVQFIPIPVESKFLGKQTLALKSLFTRNPYSINWLISQEYQKALSSFMQDSEYDLIHFDTISLAPYRKYIGDALSVLDHHNIESHMMIRRAQKEKNIFLKLYYYQEGFRLKNYEKINCSRFDLNITCSELDKLRLLEVHDKIHVTVIPNGVDLNYFSATGKSEIPDSFIFVGSMNWYPNVEAMHYFVKGVWPLLKKEVPKCILHIVGANPPDSIRHYTSVDPAIQVHGYVDDVRPYIEQASVYVCPIRDGGGTKLKLLDAFAMKKAVVAHPVSCEGLDVLPDRDVLFAETPSEFARKVLLLLRNTGLRQALGENARLLVAQKYSYDQIGNQLSEAYIKLADPRPEIVR